MCYAPGILTWNNMLTRSRPCASSAPVDLGVARFRGAGVWSAIADMNGLRVELVLSIGF